MGLPAFITIPRPIRRGNDGGFKSGGPVDRSLSKLQIYFAAGEKEQVQRAADMCGVSVSEFIRQLARTAITALEVPSDGHNQHR